LAENKRWTGDSRAHERFVLVRIGSRLIVALPDREVDLGRVDSEAQNYRVARAGAGRTDLRFQGRRHC
jgi:hypothetical protein